MPSLVNVTRSGRVATVTMTRPEKRNALDAAMVQQLLEAFEQLEREVETRVIVLTGAGSAFSAGADLDALRKLRTASYDENLADSALFAGLLKSIRLNRKPVVARVNGHAIAGGAGLVAACDISIASSDARFGFTEVRIGFVPAVVASFVIARVGEGVARDLLLSGRVIGAEEAATLGLVTGCVARGELEEETARWARLFAEETSREAVARTKRLLAELPGMDFGSMLTAGAAANAAARQTDDCKAGVDAFLQKKEPPWKDDATSGGNGEK